MAKITITSELMYFLTISFNGWVKIRKNQKSMQNERVNFIKNMEISMDSITHNAV